MKRVFLTTLAVVVAVTMIFGSTLGISAAGRFDSEYGTEADGIIPTSNYTQDYAGYYESCPGTTGFPNGDFEQGLKYWTTPRTKYLPADTVDIIEENGNHFMRFTTENTYQGIESLRFVDSRVKVGDSLAIMYKWRSDDPNFQLILQQYKMEPPSIGEIKRVSQGKGVTVVEAASDGDWNITVTQVESADNPNIGLVQEPQNESKTIYLSYVIQVCSDPTTVADIDDLQLVIYNKNTGKITDLDGKELYDANNLPGSNAEEEINADDFADIDYDAENEEVAADTESKAEDKNTEEKDESFIEKYLWVIIAGGAVILIAAAVVVIVIVVKKKKAVVPADEAPAENTPAGE